MPTRFPRRELERNLGGFGGLEFLVASPTGEFAENVAVGFGVAGHGRYAFDERGIISLRGDLGFINYGNETIRICVTQAVQEPHRRATSPPGRPKRDSFAT